MPENKTLSFHKESYGLGQLITILALTFLGALFGLCLSFPGTGAFVGFAAGLTYVYFRIKQHYACPECGSDLVLAKVDNKIRREEWICAACKRRLIAEFN